MKQIIISIEGIDGAGKSTIVHYLKDFYGKKCSIYCRTHKSKQISKLINAPFIRKNHFLQIIIYILLSHVNYRKFKKANPKLTPIIIMDRCFLSNICYFYPNALNSPSLLKFVLIFEPPIFPQKIFILDVAPSVAHKRDSFQKDLSWLKKTRNVYLNSSKSKLLKKYNIKLIKSSYNINQKLDIITHYIDRSIERI